MKGNRWNKKAEEIETFGECNNSQGLYFALKLCTAPKRTLFSRVRVQMKLSCLPADTKEISGGCKKHFHQLLNQESNVDNNATDHLTASLSDVDNVDDDHDDDDDEEEKKEEDEGDE